MQISSHFVNYIAYQQYDIDICMVAGANMTCDFATVHDLTWTYEGRSINKLQNGIILLIFKK